MLELVSIGRFLQSVHLYFFVANVRSHKLRVKLVKEQASEALLNLDALSGLTEIDLEVEEKAGVKCVTKLGISLNPSSNKTVPSQVVSMNPRYIVLNKSEELIHVRQCYLEVCLAIKFFCLSCGMVLIN